MSDGLKLAIAEVNRLRDLLDAKDAEIEKLREQNNRIAKMYEALEWDYKVALSNKETTK